MTKREKLTEAEAERILAEYPDANLSAFDIVDDRGDVVSPDDVEALAVEAAAKSTWKIQRRAR